MKALATSPLSNTLFPRNGDASFSSWTQFNPATTHQIGVFPCTKLNYFVSGSSRLYHLQPIRPSPPACLSQESQTDLEVAAETKNEEIPQSKTVRIKIQLNKECSFGEEFAVVGDDPMFGMWDPENAIPLNWSDGHVWILESDIPIGKTIQFKFILKEINGKISWQPGPDRILKTWETNNTIVVCEDWEDAAFQKLLEEEPSSGDLNNEHADDDNSDMLIVTENLTHQNEELVGDVNNGAEANADLSSYPLEEPLPPTHAKSIVADNIASSGEKTITTVADGIGSSEIDPAVSSSHRKLGENRISQDKEQPHQAIAKDVLESNEGAELVDNSDTPSNDVERNLITHQEEPVLVPGLPPLTIDGCGLEIQDLERRHSAFVASDGVAEVENRNSPELDEKQEIHEIPHQVEMIKVLINKEKLPTELERNRLANEGMQNESKSVENNVVQNDIQWGRRTIQKLLANFGFL